MLHMIVICHHYMHRYDISKCRAQNEVSKSLLSKRKKLHGFYHDKYWSHVKVSQGMTFVEESDREKKLQFKLRAIGENVENMQDEFHMMRAFIAKKFPVEDYRNIMEDEENDEVDLHERADDNVIQHEINYVIQESPHAMHPLAKAFQELLPGKCSIIKEGCANSFFPWKDMITTQPCPENYSKENYANSSLGRRRIISMKANNENSTEADEGCAVSSFLHKQPTNKESEVYLFSENPRKK